MKYFYARPSFAFFMGFVAPYLLTKINFVSTVGQISSKTESLIWLSIFAYAMGLFFCRILRPVKSKPLRGERRSSDQVSLKKRTLLLVGLYAWFVLGCLCLFYEFYSADGIPILSPDVELLRFNMQANGYVHLIAISLGIASSLLLATASFFVGLKKGLIILTGLLGFFLLSLTGNRSDFMFSIAVIFVFFLLRRERIISITWILGGACFLLAFVFLKFYREISFGIDYLGMINEQLIGEPSVLKYIFYPLYLTITYGFMVFDWLVNAGLEGLEGGRYTFYAFYSLLPGPQMDFGTYKNQALGIDFYAELTSTVISNFYVDFGAPGVFVGSFLLALCLGAAYTKAKRDRRFVLIYALLYLHTLIFFYFYIYVHFITFVHLAAYFIYCSFFLGSRYSVAVERTEDG